MQDNQKDHDSGNAAPASSRALRERATTMPSAQVLHPQPPLMEEEEEGLNFLDLWRVIVKRRWTIVTFFLIVVIAMVTATFLQTPIYQASLTLQIDRETPQIVDFQNVGQATTGGDFYQTQYELLKSRNLAERVAERLNEAGVSLAATPARPPLLELLAGWMATLSGEKSEQAESAPTRVSAGALLGGMSVTPIRNSSLVKLHYQNSNPQLAARIVNTWADAFLNMNMDRRVGASAYAKKFLEERLQQTKGRLEESERGLVDFASSEEIVNLDDRQTITSHKLQNINSALIETEQERIKAEVVYNRIRRDDTQGLTVILESPVIQQLKQVKATLESQYQEGLKIYKPAYPRMQQLASQITEVQAKLNEEVANIRSALQAEYETAKAHEEVLRARLEEAKAEAIALQNRSIQYNILKREVDTNRQLYDGLLQRYKEVGVAGGIESNNISVVDKAQVPGGSIKPDLKKNSLLAIFFGLFGGIGLAFLLERLDDTVKHPDELERRLGIPVLGIVPLEKLEQPRDRDQAQPLPLIAQQNPRSGFAEAYRSVRTALQFSTSEGAPRVLLVTSTAKGEGKSTTALSLAIHFTQIGKKVLLIDADLRNPSLHRTLQIENNLGLSNHLTGEATPAEIAKPTTVSNLFVVPSGHLPPNPGELLASARMISLLSLATEKFDQVIIDCAPVLGLADALILGNLAEGTLLVVEAGSTRRGHAQGALKRLKSAKTHVLGGVLTKLDSRKHAHDDYYHHSYYYYYQDASSPEKRLTA